MLLSELNECSKRTALRGIHLKSLESNFMENKLGAQFIWKKKKKIGIEKEKKKIILKAIWTCHKFCICKMFYAWFWYLTKNYWSQTFYVKGVFLNWNSLPNQPTQFKYYFHFSHNLYTQRWRNSNIKDKLKIKISQLNGRNLGYIP